MQTKERGKHDILPVAGASLDHALVPVMLPRNSDADMRRDGSATPPRVHIPPSMSAEECTARQDSLLLGRIAFRRGAEDLVAREKGSENG